MAEKRNRRMLELKGDLKGVIKSLRQAQLDLVELRAMGADESSIRRVMLSTGFGSVAPDEFLAVSTGEEMGRLVLRIGRARLN